jgi:MoaA/NifB/PqqE/SkfB family radical SAM enzyme
MISRILKAANKKLNPKHLYFGPEWIILGVNNVCNLHCKMCDVGTQNLETNFAQNLVGSHPLNMPLDLFKQIVDDTSKHYPNAKIGYAFTEPLIYPNLKESLVYAHQKGLQTTITTNALSLKRKAQDLIDGSLTELFVSLDGLQDTHNYIRGHKNSFQKALEGIEHLLTFPNPPQISVYCVITEWNYTALYEFVKYFDKLPLKHIGFMHQNFITEEVASYHNQYYGSWLHATHSNIEETDFSAIDIEVLQDQIQKIKKGNFEKSPSFSPELIDLGELKTYYEHPEVKIGKTCNDVFTNIMIKTDGTAIPSHGRCYNKTMGDLNKQSLPEIWNSNEYAQFRSEIVNNDGLFPACNRCCSAF